MKKVYAGVKKVIESKFVPGAAKFGASNIVQSISGGLMMTLPITLVASLFSILANFPITSVNEWLSKRGLSEQFNAMVGGTLNIISLFIIVGIAYTYTKKMNKPKGNPLVAAILALASFIVFMPQTITVGKEQIAGLSFDYLGNNGIFVAMVLGLVISRVYVALSQNKKILIKLPESVPPMVVSSFEPLVVAMIILIGVILVRIGLSLTPLNNLFNVVQIIIGGPLTMLGSSLPALLTIAVVGNLLFFFGIHPNAINSVVTPITLTMALANVEAFKTGATMPYRDVLMTSGFFVNDGTGNTLSLLLAILIFGKSARYRSLSKVSLVPNIFNINEPVVFGMPIAFNPILIVPFLLAPIVSGLIGYIGVASGFIANYNPITSLGLAYLWTLPKIITSYLTMGWQGLVVRIISIIAMIFIYLPFVKLLEKQEALEEGQMTQK